MPDRSFLDTNVLVYAFSLNDPRKKIAEDLILGGATIGVQTLNEFVNVERTRIKQPWSVVLDWVRIIGNLCPPPIPLTFPVHVRGLRIARKYGYHLYDSMMLAAALESECTTFYSEDMQDGHAVDGITIRNPFAQGYVFGTPAAEGPPE